MNPLVTGEAVALDLRPAALPSRCLAALVDAALQVALLLLLLAASFALGGGSDAADAAIGILVLVTATIAYPVGFETALRGRTPGKAALGLRTVRDDGGPIAFRHALVRGLSGAFLERPGITLGFGALACSLLHPSGKRIGDVLAGTVVLQERVPSRRGTAAVMPAPLAGWAASLDLTGLPDDLALQARSLLSRSAELSPQAREDLGSRLVAAVVARTSPPPPPDAPGWAVLSAVLAERTRREQERLGVAAAAPATPVVVGYGHAAAPGAGTGAGPGASPSFPGPASAAPSPPAGDPAAPGAPAAAPPAAAPPAAPSASGPSSSGGFVLPG